MKETRRAFVMGIVEAVGAAGIITATPQNAQAYLLGIWWLG